MVDSTNNYCLVFDLYVGNINPNEAPSQYGKVYDLVFWLCEPYLEKSYYIHMDNWYSSPIIFHHLRQQQTGAVGTVKGNRNGLPIGFSKIKLKQKGEQKTYTDNR